MNTFLITFVVFAFIMLAMAVGVIVNNRAIKGSCGGLNDIDGLEGACDICEIKSQCKRRRGMQRKALSNDTNSQNSSSGSHNSSSGSHNPSSGSHNPSSGSQNLSSGSHDSSSGSHNPSSGSHNPSSGD